MAERFKDYDWVIWTAPSNDFFTQGEKYQITDLDEGDDFPYWLIGGNGNDEWVQDSQVGPVPVAPEPPKFASIEEADAWLAAQEPQQETQQAT